MRINAADLRKRLGASPSQWAALRKAGLPLCGDGRKQFGESADVARWLAMRGDYSSACLIADTQIAGTREEAAQLLGVNARTLAGWLKLDGFPGQAGTPGKRNGYFPIDEIQEWRRQTLGVSDPEGEHDGPNPKDEYWRIKVQDAQLDLDQRLQRILDADDVGRFFQRVVATTKALLETLPDKVIAALPAGMKRDAKQAIRSRVQSDLDAAYNAIAELVAGDEDEAEA